MMPKIQGFRIETARAWWITCEICGDSELVYGLNADMAALQWATDHLETEHPGA